MKKIRFSSSLLIAFLFSATLLGADGYVFPEGADLVNPADWIATASWDSAEDSQPTATR